MITAVVVGGGIGGLATALALHRFGHEFVILEQAPALEPSGAGLQLTPNAVRILAELGLLEELLSSAYQPPSVDTLDGMDDRVLLSAALTPDTERRYGRPWLNVHRGDLQAILAGTVERRRPGALRVGSRVEGADQAEDRVTAVLTDGDAVVGDVLIGADGVHSRVRDGRFGPQPVRFTGHVAYRMLIPRGAFSDRAVPGPANTVRVGPHGHVVGYWLRGEELYNVVAILEQDWREDGWRVPGRIEDVLAAFGDWSPALREVLVRGSEVFRWALLDREPPERWAVGRIALLGDACHAMLPYLAQGAAMAIEDAWALASGLARESDACAALSAYGMERGPRVARVRDAVIRNASVMHLDTTAERAGRERALLALGGAEAPAFLSQFDWLYGHGAPQR